VIRPIRMLWWREIVRFLRQRSRVVGAFVQPLVFWLLLGSGLSASFRPGGADGQTYLQYFYPGVLAMVLLFTAIFATIAVVEDRRSGFLQGVLVAPVGRSVVVAGQALGATTLAVLQAALFIALAPLAGLPVTLAGVGGALAVSALVAFGLVSLGLAIAWRMESTQGFHAIMNLLLLPIWFLSGAVFPADGLAGPLAWAMRLDPLTYGVALLRGCFGVEGVLLPPVGLSLAVVVAFGAGAFALATAVARRSGTLG
jgi:ABC-2 type transport system permease protein